MVLPIIGPIIGGALGLIGGAMQNSAASAAADKQMRFQKESAQNQYKWAMDDMRRSGLNPILAYKQGGAGTLSGSSYTPQNIGAAAAQGVSSVGSTALAAQRQETELANIAADTALKSSQDKTQAALQIQAMAQAGQANANSALATQQTINASWQEDAIRQALAIGNPQRVIAEHDTKFWSSPAAAPLLATRRLMESLAPGASSANSAANLLRIGK